MDIQSLPTASRLQRLPDVLLALVTSFSPLPWAFETGMLVSKHFRRVLSTSKTAFPDRIFIQDRSHPCWWHTDHGNQQSWWKPLQVDKALQHLFTKTRARPQHFFVRICWRDDCALEAIASFEPLSLCLDELPGEIQTMTTPTKMQFPSLQVLDFQGLGGARLEDANLALHSPNLHTIKMGSAEIPWDMYDSLFLNWSLSCIHLTTLHFGNEILDVSRLQSLATRLGSRLMEVQARFDVNCNSQKAVDTLAQFTKLRKVSLFFSSCKNWNHIDSKAICESWIYLEEVELENAPWFCADNPCRFLLQEKSRPLTKLCLKQNVNTTWLTFFWMRHKDLLQHIELKANGDLLYLPELCPEMHTIIIHADSSETRFPKPSKCHESIVDILGWTKDWPKLRTIVWTSQFEKGITSLKHANPRLQCLILGSLRLFDGLKDTALPSLVHLRELELHLFTHSYNPNANLVSGKELLSCVQNAKWLSKLSVGFNTMDPATLCALVRKPLLSTLAITQSPAVNRRVVDHDADFAEAIAERRKLNPVPLELRLFNHAHVSFE